MELELAECTIRAWRPDDAAALARAMNNRRIWLMLRDAIPHPYTLADAESYLRKVAADPASQSFCIEVEGEVAGGIGLKPQEDVCRHTAELGYWLAEPFWNRGIMSAAVRGFVADRFRALPLHRIFAKVFSNNPASARVLEKAGFQCEGRLRHDVVKDGQILDSLVYAKLR